MANSRIPLSDLISELRNELATAKSQGQGSDFRLQVEEAEIELQVVVTREDGVSGGVKFWVVNAEAKDNYSDATTQKIKLKLKVLDSAGKTVDIRSER